MVVIQVEPAGIIRAEVVLAEQAPSALAIEDLEFPGVRAINLPGTDRDVGDRALAVGVKCFDRVRV